MSQSSPPFEEVHSPNINNGEIDEIARERLWGWIYALMAFGWWGCIFPMMLIFMNRQAEPFLSTRFDWSMEIISHRVLWSFVVCAIIIYWFNNWSLVIQVLKNPRTQGILLISSFLIACNWFGFILAAAIGKLSDASLGYYINPLVNVLLGAIFLGERMRGLQLAALFFAACGVCWIILVHGSIPWIALLLAGSFGFYGLVRKKLVIDSVVALLFESLYCMPVVIVYLTYRGFAGPDLLFHTTTLPLLGLLVLCGPVTAIPLLAFAAAAKRIPLSTLGFVQFITPTLQLFIAVFYNHETLAFNKLIGFCFIWIGVVIYIWDATQKLRSNR